MSRDQSQVQLRHLVGGLELLIVETQIKGMRAVPVRKLLDLLHEHYRAQPS